MTTMNPVVRKLWVEKLRDPETEQGRCCLMMQDGSMCCLGVLTELWRQSEDNEDDSNPCVANQGTLKDRVVAWAGLDDSNPVIRGIGSDWTLTSLNDRGNTFPEIADLIWAQL
jgi:hypothetical protein